MKVTFAIFFCVILGVTAAKHLFDEESKGFQTTEDLSLTRQEDTPEQIKTKIFHLTEGLLKLAKCLKDGTNKKQDCFTKLRKSIKLSAAKKCIDNFEKCVTGVSGVFLQCGEKFKDCVHANTGLV